MRRYFLLLLLCLLSVPSLANEDNIPMPTLPDEPIFVREGSIIRQHYIWLDNHTFRFAPYTYDNYEIGTDPYEAYEYHLSDNSLEQLDWSPFYLASDENLRDLIDFSDEEESLSRFRYLIPRFPYSQSPTEPARFLYSGNTRYECGAMCAYVISYSGVFVPEGSDGMTWVNPFMRPYLLVTFPMWAMDESFVIYLEGADFGTGCCSQSFSFIDLETNELTQQIGSNSAVNYMNAPVSNAVYALSSEFAPRVLYGDWFEGMRSELTLWTGSRLGSEECHCMLLPENKNFSLETDEHFAGANFIEGDENHFLAVAPDGLRLYEVETGEFTVINPELNSQWIDLAVFSPDNQHVAVLVDTNLYVLPTGYEG